MSYRTLRAIIRFILNIIADVEIVGLEKVPAGNIILASNHLGRLDTAVLLYAIDREDIIMAVAEKYKNHPLFGAIGRAVDAIWLNRFEADLAALREILARMQKGGMFVIAPEGTRSKSGTMQRGKMGVAFLASKSGFPVLPIAISGTEDQSVVANLKRFQRIKIRAVAGQLFRIEIPTGRGREEAMQNATDEIMCQIAALLPESYRGVYTDHPRTRELLQQHANAA